MGPHVALGQSGINATTVSLSQGIGKVNAWRIPPPIYSSQGEVASTGMPNRVETPETEKDRSSALWMVAAWISFLAWLFHSFAVRAFFDSLHGAGKLLGGH